MVDGGGKGTFKTLEISGIGDVVGIGDRVDASRDSGLNLGQTFAEAGCKRGAGLVEGACGCRCSAGPPRDGG
jgi:hypothetical protein